MLEQRILEKVLDKIGISLYAQWLPSIDNIFADRLSKTCDPRDTQIRSTVRCTMLNAYALLGVAADGAWAYRFIGVHPIAMRKVTLAALKERWGPERALLFCPPTALWVLILL